MSQSPIHRLFAIAVTNAKRAIGPEVFKFQPVVLRKALVAREILTIVNNQDDDVTAERIRKIALELDYILGGWDGADAR